MLLSVVVVSPRSPWKLSPYSNSNSSLTFSELNCRKNKRRNDERKN
jgi:hypothetical protein